MGIVALCIHLNTQPSCYLQNFFAMMLTRFALLAVVVVALAEARRGGGGPGGRGNACGEALKPDRATMKEYKEACKDDDNKRKCVAEKQGWVTTDGEFDEAAFRSYIVGKVADASDEVKTHVEAALDNCLSAETMATFAVGKITSCLMKGC